MTWIKGLGRQWTFHGREPVTRSTDTVPLLSGGGHMVAAVSRPGSKEKSSGEIQWSSHEDKPDPVSTLHRL